VAAMRRAAFRSGLTVRDLGASAAVMRVGRREVKRRMVLVNMVLVLGMCRREGMKCRVLESWMIEMSRCQDDGYMLLYTND
jgi:hypothetical protein